MKKTEFKVLVWDLPLRLFHWSLVICVLGVYFTGIQGGLRLESHRQFGLLIMGLLVFRFIWGFVGGHYARFQQFWPTPKRLTAWYQLPASRRDGLGHTPLAGMAILLMLFMLLVQSLTGLFTYNDEIDLHGPLALLLSEHRRNALSVFHTQFAYAALLVVIVHLVAIVFYQLIGKHQLIIPMITGRKTTSVKQSIESKQPVALTALLIAIGIPLILFIILNNESVLAWLFNT